MNNNLIGINLPTIKITKTEDTFNKVMFRIHEGFKPGAPTTEHIIDVLEIKDIEDGVTRQLITLDPENISLELAMILSVKFVSIETNIFIPMMVIIKDGVLEIDTSIEFHMVQVEPEKITDNSEALGDEWECYLGVEEDADEALGVFIRKPEDKEIEVWVALPLGVTETPCIVNDDEKIEVSMKKPPVQVQE